MNDNLIFDVGCNNGDDSLFFLNNGFDVLGVECSPYLVKNLLKRFENNNRFMLVDRCISDVDDSFTNFYLSNNNQWNSCNKDIAERLSGSVEIRVKTVTLQKLFDFYGVPKYCKIDIEGNDIVALNSELPTP